MNDNQNYNLNQSNQIINNTIQPEMNTNQVKKNANPVVKVLAIVGGLAVALFVLVFAILGITSANSNKLVCKSDQGNITIMYNDDEITGYSAVNMGYDLDEQKSYAKSVGIDNYLEEFSTWFATNTTGSCTIKEK